MPSKITITIEEGCDDNGNGGTVVAKPIALLPDQVWSDTKDACAEATGWTDTIVDEHGNEIPNPVNTAWNVTVAWRQRSEALLRAHLKRSHVFPVEQSIEADIEQANAAITVIDGMAE